MQFIEAGRAACVSMYEIIDRKPAIDASRPGTILENVSDIPPFLYNVLISN
jgi:hypothetical protein